MGLYIVDIVEVSVFIVGSTSHTDLVDILDGSTSHWLRVHPVSIKKHTYILLSLFLNCS